MIKWGETVKGIVVVNEKISDKEIIDFVKTKIASYKCPKSIDFVEIFQEILAVKFYEEN